MRAVGSKLMFVAALMLLAVATTGCAKSACNKLLPTCDACPDAVTRNACSNVVFGEDENACQAAIDQNSFPTCPQQ